MFKLIGSILIFLSGYSLQYGFELSLVLWFLFGLFLIFAQAIGGHLLFIHREKVRARYRNRLNRY
jgi:hypothetical protein